VHEGDWKLIRIFHGGEEGSHRWKLFNLRNDLGERQDLSGSEPARVQRMDALIEAFLNETEAVRPIPNPQFNPAVYRPQDEGKGKIRDKATPKKTTKSAAADNEFPGLQGWKARHTNYTVKDGIVVLTGNQPNPFLGIGAGASGPAKVTFRTRSAKGGAGRVESLPSGKKAQSVPFDLKPGDWTDTVVTLPATGPLGILRLYLPAQEQSVELDWVELVPEAGKPRRWEF
jgi:hypothetical protein